MFFYGFAAEEELQMFETLTSVSKIGPKAALNILSALKPIDIRMAILTNDIKLLSKVNGIGAKTAERLVLELKDKIEDVKLWELNQIPDKSNAKIMEEAVLALVGLGYSKSQAESAVKQVEAEDLESYIKLALKKLF
jgi:Holliday junction DNA helicase RuvA